MDKLILGIDAGNYKAKVAGVHGVDTFRTNICDWFERDVEETFGQDDMEFEIDGRKGYAGTIAIYENEFGTGATYGDTKAHEDSKIRILLAIYRYITKYSLDISSIYVVVGQPIVMHKAGEKIKIIDMIIGEHDFTVNRQRIKFEIKDAKVAMEGSAAFWSNPSMHSAKIIDIGSGTVNMATVFEKHYIHHTSGTMSVGMETLKNQKDLDAVARAIYQHATKLKWKKDSEVYVCGGVTDTILPYIQKQFPNAQAVQPKLRREYDFMTVPATFANAVGFYTLGKGAFK
ncbi:plasmid segregation protein ParM [Lysinibacillus composti]|uniref:Actin-like protein N-terminal domain-containing protein n=1 Tax=Lysinibacillus composti TaxID=720633 RepID=A0A3N9UIU3_9BACI|nr:hypothetical protein [Lysinibacillus composti]MBM7607595.1 plasmid segregation protein ParM [Lysinibacillus composti]RQW75901.1 hypothetical protein EBB45_04605 [Lysinibacillus composti]